MIEDGHRRARNVLEEHIEDALGILVERETIDKDQFQRLLAGESEEAVFPVDRADHAGRQGSRRRSEAQGAPAARSRSRCRARRCSHCRLRELSPGELAFRAVFSAHPLQLDYEFPREMHERVRMLSIFVEEP